MFVTHEAIWIGERAARNRECNRTYSPNDHIQRRQPKVGSKQPVVTRRDGPTLATSNNLELKEESQDTKELEIQRTTQVLQHLGRHATPSIMTVHRQMAGPHVVHKITPSNQERRESVKQPLLAGTVQERPKWGVNDVRIRQST
jgi:hypothetical protein